jgi:hypothetical protein
MHNYLWFISVYLDNDESNSLDYLYIPEWDDLPPPIE